MCHPRPVTSSHRHGWPTVSPPNVPLARIIFHNKRRFNWGSVTSKPAYAVIVAKPGRRARTAISKHITHFLDEGFIGNETTNANNCPQGANFSVSGPQPMQCGGQLLKGQLGRIAAVVFADVKSKFMELPRQGRHLLVGEGSKCVHDDNQPTHNSLAHGLAALVQPLATHSVQVYSTTIPVVRIVAQYPLLHTRGDNDDSGAQDCFASLQCFGSQLPASHPKSPLVANLPSAGGHASLCPSLGFVALHGCCAPVVVHPPQTCSHGDDNDGANPVCVKFHQPCLGGLKAIRIPSMKLVCLNELVMGTSVETWAVGYVLENYTCLSSGRDLYDVEFGVSYGNQTVLVCDCELVCDGEEHLHCSDTVLQPFVQGALEGDDMTFPNLGSASHGTPPLVDGHGLCRV